MGTGVGKGLNFGNTKGAKQNNNSVNEQNDIKHLFNYQIQLLKLTIYLETGLVIYLIRLKIDKYLPN